MLDHKLIYCNFKQFPCAPLLITQIEVAIDPENPYLKRINALGIEKCRSSR